MPNEGEVRRAVEDLRKAANDFVQLVLPAFAGVGNLTEAHKAQLRERFGTVERKLAAVTALLGPGAGPAPPSAPPGPAVPGESAGDSSGGTGTAGKPPASFADFMQQIGKAVVSAQRELDTASHAYTHLAGPLAIPTTYRIPKISASLRFALEHKTGSEFNVLIYSSVTESRELNQQTLDMEIVAVPPAPDLVAAIEQRRPRLSVVTDPGLRGQLLEKFMASPGLDAKAPEFARNNPGRVVFAVSPPRAGNAPFTEDVLVLMAEFTQGPEPGAAGAWYMTIRDGTVTSGAEVIVPFDKPAATLHQFAESLCDMQAKLATLADG